MKKRRRPKICLYAVLFALATLAMFIVPVWLIAVMEALIILFFAWMLFFGCQEGMYEGCYRKTVKICGCNT